MKTALPKTKQEPAQDTSRKFELKDVILLIIGVVLLITAVILSLFFPDLKGIQPNTMMALLAVSIALIASQIPGKLDAKFPFGIKAAGGIAFGLIIYFIVPQSLGRDGQNVATDCIEKPAITENTDDCKFQPFRVAILCSGDTDYSRNITASLINELQFKLTHDFKRCLSYYLRNGPRGTYKDEKVQQEYYNEVDNLMKRGTYEYYVAIGTSASIALHSYFKKNNIDRKLIFLGVTDPVKSRLVETLTDREDKANIAGVAYCGNFEQLPSKIKRLYPDKKIVYIYNKNNVQDEQLASRIKDMNLVDDGTLQIVSLENDPADSNFVNRDAVYFSWVTFENMFMNENIEVLKKIKHVVSTTQTHAEQGLVPFAVSVSDQSIGKEGARIILDSWNNKKHLGKYDVFIPNWRIFVNCRVARQSNLSENSITNADERYDCD